MSLPTDERVEVRQLASDRLWQGADRLSVGETPRAGHASRRVGPVIIGTRPHRDGAAMVTSPSAPLWRRLWRRLSLPALRALPRTSPSMKIPARLRCAAAAQGWSRSALALSVCPWPRRDKTLLPLVPPMATPMATVFPPSAPRDPTHLTECEIRRGSVALPRPKAGPGVPSRCLCAHG
jgi:hypothetical protein